MGLRSAICMERTDVVTIHNKGAPRLNPEALSNVFIMSLEQLMLIG